MTLKNFVSGAAAWIALGLFWLMIPAVGDAQTAKIKLGSSLSPPSLDSITPYVAIEKGFFKKYGLDAEVVEFRGDATHVKALLSGEIDLSINMGATEAIVSASKKAPIRLWVVANPITLLRAKRPGRRSKRWLGKASRSPASARSRITSRASFWSGAVWTRRNSNTSPSGLRQTGSRRSWLAK